MRSPLNHCGAAVAATGGPAIDRHRYHHDRTHQDQLHEGAITKQGQAPLERLAPPIMTAAKTVKGRLVPGVRSVAPTREKSMILATTASSPQIPKAMILYLRTGNH